MFWRARHGGEVADPCLTGQYLYQLRTPDLLYGRRLPGFFLFGKFLCDGPATQNKTQDVKNLMIE
jgi:hypothetical protein